MISLELGPDVAAHLERVRALGRAYLRPLGIEADRNRAPVPAEHPFFKLAWQSGIGMPIGTDEPAGQRKGPRTAARRGVLVAEEMSYWDRGMSVAMPGLGLRGAPASWTWAGA